MKQIRTKKYIKFAQMGNYPPGVTGREPYFQAPLDDRNEKGTFTIIRNGQEFNVTIEYTIDMNVGFGENPNINIDDVLRVTNEINQDIPDFELDNNEVQEIKNVIIDNGNFNEDVGPDSRDE
jgi:hypothetical protein